MGFAVEAVLVVADAEELGQLLGAGSGDHGIGEDDEVGTDYATFVMNLIRWVAGEELIRRPLPDWDSLAELPPLERAPGLRVESFFG